MTDLCFKRSLTPDGVLVEGNRSLVVLVVKTSPANAGDMGAILVSERSRGVGNGHPLQYNCLEKFHGQRNLAGYRPCIKELDIAEPTPTRTHTHRNYRQGNDLGN